MQSRRKNIHTCNYSTNIINQSINQSINLFVIKGHRPLTHHINSKTITTKMQNYTGYKDELTYNISYRTT